MALNLTDGRLVKAIRTEIDPLIMKLRQELFGSGVSFNTVISTTVLPSIVVTQNNITNVVNNIVLSGSYMKGFALYNNGTLVGSGYTDLNFIGMYNLTGAGYQGTIDDRYKITERYLPTGRTITLTGSQSMSTFGEFVNDGVITVSQSGVFAVHG